MRLQAVPVPGWRGPQHSDARGPVAQPHMPPSGQEVGQRVRDPPWWNGRLARGCHPSNSRRAANTGDAAMPATSPLRCNSSMHEVVVKAPLPADSGSDRHCEWPRDWPGRHGHSCAGEGADGGAADGIGIRCTRLVGVPDSTRLAGHKDRMRLPPATRLGGTLSLNPRGPVLMQHCVPQCRARPGNRRQKRDIQQPVPDCHRHGPTQSNRTASRRSADGLEVDTAPRALPLATFKNCHGAKCCILFRHRFGADPCCVQETKPQSPKDRKGFADVQSCYVIGNSTLWALLSDRRSFNSS